MHNLKVQDKVEFELYDCVGLVLKIENGNYFDDTTDQKVLTFSPRSKVVSTRKLKGTWYAKSNTVYQILIGNKKGWVGDNEIAAVLEGKELL